MKSREIHLSVDETSFPQQMQNMKTLPLVSKSLGLLSLAYNCENEGKKILIYDPETDTFEKIKLG